MHIFTQDGIESKLFHLSKVNSRWDPCKIEPINPSHGPICRICRALLWQHGFTHSLIFDWYLSRHQHGAGYCHTQWDKKCIFIITWCSRMGQRELESLHFVFAHQQWMLQHQKVPTISSLPRSRQGSELLLLWQRMISSSSSLYKVSLCPATNLISFL